MSRLTKAARLLVFGGLSCPAALLLRAAFLLVVFAAFHLLGWRDDTRIFSGTSLTSNGAVARGLLYALGYYAAVLVCPILVLAAGIGALTKRRH